MFKCHCNLDLTLLDIFCFKFTVGHQDNRDKLINTEKVYLLGSTNLSKLLEDMFMFLEISGYFGDDALKV